MPLHDLGYRSWEGTKHSLSSRWWVIASTGIRLAWRSTWLSRTLVLAWVPVIVFGVFFFFYEMSIADPNYRQFMRAMVMSSGAAPEIERLIIEDPEAARHVVWSSLLLTFFRYPQGVLMVVVLAMVSPRLISYDLRNRGYLLYFSRPVHLSGYIFGKWMVIWSFVALITTLPAIVLYVVGLSLSPQMDVVFGTWDLPLRILVASLVLVIPTGAVALACSAATVESRYAVFGWFAIWIIGWVAYSILRVGELAASGGRPFRGGRRQASMLTEQSNWELLSPFHVLGRAQQYVFGLYPEEHSILPQMAILGTVTLFSFWFIGRQIRSRLQA